MIKTILVCLAYAPFALCLWVITFQVIRAAFNQSRNPKDDARRVKEFCANRKGENACRGCPFENIAGDCSLKIALPDEWEL